MALTRSYHRARTHTEILRILEEERGRKHDPELLGLFLDVVEASAYRARS